MEDKVVWGDGGPLIVLQATAVARWKGAGPDFEHSLMNGGGIETDYDVACTASQYRSYHARRYNRDMLVLDDCEVGGRIFALPRGSVVIVTYWTEGATLQSILRDAGELKPKKSFGFIVKDTWLRLLVAACEGDGKPYGCSDVPIVPGRKRCDVYEVGGMELVTIRPLEANPST